MWNACLLPTWYEWRTRFVCKTCVCGRAGGPSAVRAYLRTQIARHRNEKVKTLKFTNGLSFIFAIRKRRAQRTPGSTDRVPVGTVA